MFTAALVSVIPLKIFGAVLIASVPFTPLHFRSLDTYCTVKVEDVDTLVDSCDSNKITEDTDYLRWEFGKDSYERPLFTFLTQKKPTHLKTFKVKELGMYSAGKYTLYKGEGTCSTYEFPNNKWGTTCDFTPLKGPAISVSLQ